MKQRARVIHQAGCHCFADPHPCSVGDKPSARRPAQSRSGTIQPMSYQEVHHARELVCVEAAAVHTAEDAAGALYVGWQTVCRSTGRRRSSSLQTTTRRWRSYMQALYVYRLCYKRLCSISATSVE
jgi:hypothetical protein